jgi:hypothetical protein
VNYANGVWEESKINSIEQRSFNSGFDNFTKETDANGTYLYRSVTGNYPNPYLTYSTVSDNPFNICSNSELGYPYSFTLVCKGRVDITNRSDYSGWPGLNNYMRVGTSDGGWMNYLDVLSNSCGDYTSGSNSDIICIRLNNGALEGWNITTNTKVQTTLSQNIPAEANRLSTALCFCAGRQPSGESKKCWCYWWYYSQDVLSDNEVMNVVQYNNSINRASL